MSGWLRPRIEAFFVEVGRFFVLLWRVFAWTPRPPYDFRQLGTQMVRIGVDSVPVVLLTALFTGGVMALQTFATLKRFNAEGYVGSLVAISMVRELAPVLSALILAGRCGSAMGAELGTMRVTEQIDALATMGVSPVQYLVTPRMLASVLMLPLLCVLFTCVGMAGSWVVAVRGLGLDPGVYIANVEAYLELEDFTMGMIKSLVFGFLVSVISCHQGFHASGGARGVGQATTRAVVNSAVAILIANYLLTSWLMGI